MAEPPPSGTGQQDKSYFKNSVAKDGKAKAFAKAVTAGTKKVVDDVSTEVKLSRQYEVPKMEWEGVWASQYPSNDGKDGRVDLIRLDKDRTGKIIATKLTGNRFVPAGKVSFEAILHKNGMMGRGRALLACDGFVDPRWVAGEFHADSADTFSFHWTDDQFVIYFHRYDPDTEKPVMDDDGQAITNTYLYEGRPRAD